MARDEVSGHLPRIFGVQLDPELMILALTHRSFAHEAGDMPTNERLEFLGDTVLGLVVTEQLYRNFPDLPEGELAKKRSAIVSQRALAEVARELEIGQFILLGRGEKANGGDDKDSILSDTLEALFGAIYLAHGLEVAREVVLRTVGNALARAVSMGAGLDYKTSLQELLAEHSLGAPHYEVTGEGPDHDRFYTARVFVGGHPVGTGNGKAKKVAQQEAAGRAYELLASTPVDELTLYRRSTN